MRSRKLLVSPSTGTKIAVHGNLPVVIDAKRKPNVGRMRVPNMDRQYQTNHDKDVYKGQATRCG